MGVPVDDVLSLLKVSCELVELGKAMPVLGDADGFALVVILRSYENADYSARYVVLAMEGDAIFVRFVIQSLELCLDMWRHGLLLLLFRIVSDTLVEVDVVVIEEGHEWGDLDVLDANAGQYNVVVLVGGHRVLVMVEQGDDLLVELVEGWIANGDFSYLEDGGRIVVDTVHFRSVAEKLTCGGLEAAIVPWVDAAASSLDDFSKDVQTVRLVDREENALRGKNVSVVNGVH